MSLTQRLRARQRRAKLRPEVEAYLDRTGMAPSRFSQLAVNDPCFVAHLRNDWGVIGAKRCERVRAFMADHPNGEAA